MRTNRPPNHTSDASSVAVIVLGAGTGSRFGREDKLGAFLAGKPLAHHILPALRPFNWAEKILVYRNNPSWIAAYQAEAFSLVRNNDSKRGMLGSLHAGCIAAAGHAKILVCLADMPLLDSGHIARLMSEAENAKSMIVASRGAGYHGPPAIFPAEALMHLPTSGEGGARSLLTNALFVDCAVGTLFDVDTRQDLDVIRCRI